MNKLVHWNLEINLVGASPSVAFHLLPFEDSYSYLPPVKAAISIGEHLNLIAHEAL